MTQEWLEGKDVDRLLAMLRQTKAARKYHAQRRWVEMMRRTLSPGTLEWSPLTEDDTTPLTADYWSRTCSEQNASQCDALRCIAGNPFRESAIDPDWITPDVLTVARSAYNGLLPGQTFDGTDLSALADALEESGGVSLAFHLREEPTHWRGCHVVDRILGFG